MLLLVVEYRILLSTQHGISIPNSTEKDKVQLVTTVGLTSRKATRASSNLSTTQVLVFSFDMINTNMQRAIVCLFFDMWQ